MSKPTITTAQAGRRGWTVAVTSGILLHAALGGAELAAQPEPLELEARAIRVLSMRPYETADGWQWGALHFPFLWRFSQTPVVVLNVLGGDPPSEVFPAAPLNVSPEGFDLTLTDNGGAFFHDTLRPPLEAGHLHGGVMRMIAVVPDRRRNIIGNVELLEDGAFIPFPEWFVTSARNHARSQIDPIVLVNAQRDRRPLRAAAVYEETQYRSATKDYAPPIGFTLRLADVTGQTVSGSAEVHWLAVLPGADNPFRGRVYQGYPAESIQVYPRLRTGTYPRIVTNARQGDAPLVSAADAGETFGRAFTLHARDADGNPFVPTYQAMRAGLARIDAPWLAVEPFYNTHRHTSCRLAVVSEQNRIGGDPWFFAEASALVTQQIGSSEVDRGERGYYTLVEILGPPDRETCTVDLSYDLRIIGIIDRFATPASPLGATKGTYDATIVTGIVPEQEFMWTSGASTTLWQGATDLKQEFVQEVGQIIVGQALGFGVTGAAGATAGRVVGLWMNLVERTDDAITCDEQVHREGPVRFSNVPVRVGGRYKVFVYVDGEAIQAALGLLADGYTEIDFAGQGPMSCEQGSDLYRRKALRISNVELSDPDTTLAMSDSIRYRELADRHGQEQPNRAYQPWDSLVTAWEVRWREAPPEPTPPAPPGPSTLHVNALNDRPGPVTIVVLGFDQKGERLVENALQWRHDDNTFSTESTELPAGVVAVSLIFMNDAYRPGGPDDDRNAFIDFLEWEGARLEAEDFDRTGGRGNDPGCGRRPDPQASGGYVADCGNGGDYVIFYRPHGGQ